jgi:hypothetical protein
VKIMSSEQHTLRPEIIVASEEELHEAVKVSGATVILSQTITLLREVEIKNISQGLIVDGRGWSVIGQGSTRCLNVNDAEVNFHNLTIQDGRAQDGGGVFVNGNATVSFSSVFITDNSAAQNGGGIWVGGGSIVSFVNSEITTSHSENVGGAIFAEKGSEISVTETKLKDNMALLGGGGVFARGDAKVFFKKSVFTGNSANSKNFGAAIYNNGGSIILAGSFLDTATETVKGSVSVYSTCPIGSFNVGDSAVRCTSGWCTGNPEDGRYTVPANLLGGECTTCAEGTTTSCCGSRSDAVCVHPSSVTTCSAFEMSLCHLDTFPPSETPTLSPIASPTEDLQVLTASPSPMPEFFSHVR